MSFRKSFLLRFEIQVSLFGPAFLQSMSFHIDMKMSRSLACSGWNLFSAVVLWIPRRNCSVVCPGNVSTRTVRGDESARWPNSIPPGGVAQGCLLIPGISSKFGVIGGVEQHDRNGSGTSRSGL